MKSNVISFIFGATIGSVAAWYITKKKIEKDVEESIEDVKRHFTEKLEKILDEDFEKRKEGFKAKEFADKIGKPLEEGLKEGINKVNKDLYSSMLNSYKYVDHVTNNDDKKDEIEEVIESKETKFVIPPEEFGEDPDYEKVSLIYYNDGVVAYDDNKEIVYNVEELIGLDSLDHFGEYEDDSVYVQNDEKKTYYEILSEDSEYYKNLK